LEEILFLTKAGLTEMRALLFELRPESLANEGLIAALSKQIAAIQVRHSLDIQTELSSEPAVSLVAKEAFYRIALEALNNIVKHAEASQVKIKLEVQDKLLKLTIVDDGKGFTPQAAYPGHLGITSMQERAVKINASLKIESNGSNGTSLLLTYPLN
jgi:signal transduction histidine kinase